MGYTAAADGALTATRTPTQTVDDLQAGYDRIEEIGGLIRNTRDYRLALTTGQVKVGWLFYETDTGVLWQRQADSWRIVGGADGAFASAEGFAYIPSSAGLTVTLPAGRFSQVPLIFATPQAPGIVVVPHVTAITTTSFLLRLFTLAGASVTGNCAWEARQRTPTNVNG